MLIAQLSDPHVCAPGLLYKGVADSNRLLSDAIRHLQQLDRQPDLVLITGDLTDVGRPQEYSMFRELIGALALPHLLMPGNHDHRENFRQAFAEVDYLPKQGALHFCIDDHPIRIVALDSCQPGKHHGFVDDEGLRWLDQTLSQNRHKPTLVAIHHPPFKSGINYIDDYRLFDAQPLEAIIRSYDNIEAVVCGHVHRAIFRRWAGTVVAACPSTCTEIALRLNPAATGASFMGPTACLLHLWEPTTGMVSHLSHIGRYPGPYSFF